MDINISEQAKTRFNQMIIESRSKNNFLRVYLRRVSLWHGPVFDIALDELNNNDVVFEKSSYKIILTDDLAANIGTIEILYKPGISKSGFRVNTDLIWKKEFYDKNWSI